MERQPTARPVSTRPPSAMSIPRSAMASSMSSRPFTQQYQMQQINQNLTGLRPPPTGLTGIQSAASGAPIGSALSGRMYRDKRFYVGRVQAHMNAIREEVARLNKSTLDYRVQSLNRSEMRRHAEETARRLSEQQDLLTVYNTALDMHLSKTRTEEIATETAELKRRNDTLLAELDNVFQRKVKKEEEMEEYKKKISQEDEFIKSLIEKLPSASKEKYFALAEENQRTLDNISSMQEKIKRSREMIEKYRANITQSMNKQKKLQLLRNLTKLKNQRTELEAFVRNTLTPAQQREKLLEQVKKDKADIDSLLKVKTSIEGELQANESRFSDLEHELQGKDNARLKKHRELRERGEHMERFLNEYEHRSVEIGGKIRRVNADIAISLEHLAENLAEINLKELDVKYDANEENTLEGWTNKYKMLSSQITRVNLAKERYEKEIETMKEKMKTMREDLELYSDIEKGQTQLMQKKNDLSDKESQLRHTLESTKAAVIEAKKKRDEMKRNIDENEDYNEIMKLEKKIEETEKRNKELEGMIKAETMNAVMEDMMAQLDAVLKKRNEQLIEELKRKPIPTKTTMDF